MIQSLDDSSHCRTRHRRSRALFVVVLCAAVVLAPIVFAADTVIVSQRNRKFSPDNLQIARGTIVQIVNDDKVTHHIFVDAPGLSFDSGEQPIGKTVELHFDQRGTYDVYCAIHPTMHLAVTVE